MNKREKIKTKHKDIVKYWSKHQNESGLSVDWIDAEQFCWRCGCESKVPLERCHIVPYSLGGEDSPSNLILLCKRCHAEAPNVVDPEIMWDWVRAYGTTFYGTFWSIKAQQEYAFIYKSEFYDDVLKIISGSGIDTKDKVLVNDLITKFFNEAIKKASVHFGQPYYNTSTYAGVLRMIVKDMADVYAVKEKR